MRPRGSSVQLEQRRRDAMAMLGQGMKPATVARALRVSLVSVGRWRKAMSEGGGKALAAKAHPGRSTKLSADHRQQLEELLRLGPIYHGFATELWTLKHVAEVIQRRFGVNYHPSGVWRILRSMNWSCQKPQCLALERDEQAIEHWRTVEWLRLKKRQKSWKKRAVSR